MCTAYIIGNMCGIDWKPLRCLYSCFHLHGSGNLADSTHSRSFIICQDSHRSYCLIVHQHGCYFPFSFAFSNPPSDTADSHPSHYHPPSDTADSHPSHYHPPSDTTDSHPSYYHPPSDTADSHPSHYYPQTQPTSIPATTTLPPIQPTTIPPIQSTTIPALPPMQPVPFSPLLPMQSTHNHLCTCVGSSS